MSFLPTWLLVGIAMLVVLIVIFKTINKFYIVTVIKNNLFYFFAFLVFIFFAFSLLHLNNKYDLDLSSSNGWSLAGKIYLSWFVNIGKNIGRVTGYAIQQNWTDTSINITKGK